MLKLPKKRRNFFLRLREKLPERFKTPKWERSILFSLKNILST